MAIKQLKFVKSNGKSALGIHEYIARLGEYRDNPDKCLVTGFENLPVFAGGDPHLFWKMADAHERANAKVCTHVVVALPRELSVDVQSLMVEDFVQRNFKGCPLSWAIHEGKDQHNPHAHLQICERRIETEREAAFSEKRFFKRNGVKKDRTLNERKFCSHLYRQYAGSINHYLERVGSNERLSIEAKNNDFEEMTLFEKLQKNFDQEMAELEKRQAEEMAALLNKINMENKDEREEAKNESGRGESPDSGTESGNPEKARESGINHQSIDQEAVSGSGDGSAASGFESINGSQRDLQGDSGNSDGGSGGMGVTAGSEETGGFSGSLAGIGAKFLELAGKAIKALFKSRLLQKLKFFRKEKFTEEESNIGEGKKLDAKIEEEVKMAVSDFGNEERTGTQEKIEKAMPLRIQTLERRFEFFKTTFRRDIDTLQEYYSNYKALRDRIAAGEEAVEGYSYLRKMDEKAIVKGLEKFQEIEEGIKGKPSLSYSYSVLRFNYMLFTEICDDDKIHDQYYQTSVELMNKRKNNLDFSWELEQLWRMNREAVEAAREKRRPLEPEQPSWKDKWSASEVQQIEAEINRLENQLENAFIPLGEDKIPKGYKTFVVAEKEGEKVIIDFCKDYGIIDGNLKPAVRKSSIQEIRDLNSAYLDLDDSGRGYFLRKEGGSKFDWMVYEAGDKRGQTVEGELKGEFKSAKLDENLRLRFQEIFNILSCISNCYPT